MPPATGCAARLLAGVCLPCRLQRASQELPVTYVCAQHDRALAVYPVPHALVLAGASPMAAHQFQDCVCLNPVCLIGRLTAALWLDFRCQGTDVNVPNCRGAWQMAPLRAMCPIRESQSCVMFLRQQIECESGCTTQQTIGCSQPAYIEHMPSCLQETTSSLLVPKRIGRLCTASPASTACILWGLTCCVDCSQWLPLKSVATQSECQHNTLRQELAVIAGPCMQR